MKQRLDLIIFRRGIVQSLERARSLIMAGKVLVNNHPMDKPGILISEQDEIVLKKGEDIPFVSRGGLKLEAALKFFEIDVRRFVCMDVGASTGGFTDCLLQHGASRVFAVDVGYGQLAWKLRQDHRVVTIERTNIRYMNSETIPCALDLITIDVSFISLKIVVPAVLKFLKPDGKILALIKPQFEVEKGKVGKGGVVRDSALHDEVIKSLFDYFHQIGLSGQTIIPSPIEGPKGNKEFIVYMKYLTPNSSSL